MRLLQIGFMIGCLGPSLSHAEDPYTVTLSRLYGTNSNDEGRKIAVDNLGNAYITGITNANFGGQSYHGGGDAFLTKIDPFGNTIWSRLVGSSGYDRSNNLTLDLNGNIFLTGNTDGSISGPNQGLDDSYVSKFDSTGNHLWTKQFGTAGYDISRGLAPDGNGGVYVTGLTEGNLDGQTNSGSDDAFIRRMDSNGNLVWTRLLGTPSVDGAFESAVNAAGELFVTGFTDGKLGGAQQGNSDAFLSKLDSSGNLQWTRQYGTPASDNGWGLQLNSNGEIFIGGNTEGDLDAHPHDGTRDAYVTKFNPSGSMLWTSQVTSSGSDNVEDLALDANGAPYVTGLTTADYDGHPVSGSSDAFITKFSDDGTKLWSRVFGSTGIDYGYGIASNAPGDIFLTGFASGNFEGNFNHGFGDAYLLRLSAPEPAAVPLFLPALILAACRSRRHSCKISLAQI